MTTLAAFAALLTVGAAIKLLDGQFIDMAVYATLAWGALARALELYDDYRTEKGI